MNASREEIRFALTLEKPVDKRPAFLDVLCEGDSALRTRIEALLAAHEAQDSLLAEPSVAKNASATIKLDFTDAPDEAVGQTLGRYKLLERVGEGGCGVVYVAEQTEPVRRRVALKVIKLGMDTKQVVARFEAERQALAMMDHPNIAKVLDAGTTDVGRPFFVMELVRGIRITEYCDQANLTTKDRLDLFIKVCQAIQHAHQKGIIHRDIKPSNILVTMHDGVPVPKVIDFGIAKATEGRLTDSTVYTQLHQFIGTPAYMSPEQAEMSGLDIDTRSDIYSLGVLLYELLAGSTPFDAKELVASGIDAMRKIIREKEPVRPSTRFATLKGEELTTTAKRRSADSSKLMHQLKGDLDWIVMKCLEKDRTRRYDTANGLAMDLKRHLNNEPVVARPPSAAYRFQKAFRRNKLAFSAGLAVAAALLVGISASVWQAARATQAKIAADASSLAAKASEQKARNAEAGETRLRQQADAQALAARRLAYSSDMNLAQQSLAANNLGRALTLLNRQRPLPGQADLRGWEWRYLWGQTRADDHEVFFSGTNRLLHPVFFSGDGRLLVREWNGEAVVTDLISRRTVWQRTNVWHSAFAHHGARLAYSSSNPESRETATNDAIIVVDLSTQKEVRHPVPWETTGWIGFSTDDRLLLVVSVSANAPGPGRLRFDLTALEADTGRQVWQRGVNIRRNISMGRSVAVSPDGTAFAMALPGGRVQVLEIADGSERFTIKATQEMVAALAFSLDGKALVSGAGYTDVAIQIWGARDGAHLGTLEGHRSWVGDLIFTPDGSRLISASADQTIRLWDWSSRKPTGVLRGHLDEVDGVEIAADGRTLASRCKDGSVYLWDVTKPSGHPGYRTFRDRLDFQTAAFTSDSRSVVAADMNGRVAVWDTLTLNETRHLCGESTNRSSISADASCVVQADADGRLHVWDVQSGLERTNFLVGPELRGVWPTDNAKFLVTFSNRPTTNFGFEIWETDTARRTGLISVQGNRVIGPPATLSLPNSFAIATPETIQFFDVAKPNQAPTQIKIHQSEFYGLAVSPDGRIAAAAYGSGFVRLWDLTTLHPMDAVKGFLLGAHSVTFSPDGKRFAAGSNGQEAVKLWDTDTRQEVLTLSGEGSMFYFLRFSPDGRLLLGINEGGVAHLWSAPSWEEIAALEAKGKTENRQ